MSWMYCKLWLDVIEPFKSREVLSVDQNVMGVGEKYKLASSFK